MKSILVFGLIVLVAGVLVAPAALAGLILSAPVDVIGNLSAARFTMVGYGALVQIAVTSKNAPGLRHGDFKPQARRSKPQAQLGLERPGVPI